MAVPEKLKQSLVDAESGLPATGLPILGGSSDDTIPALLLAAAAHPDERPSIAPDPKIGPPVNAPSEPDANAPPQIFTGNPPPEIAAPEASAPKLAPQGPKNKILSFLSRFTGMTEAQPEPGKPYEGPTTEKGKQGALGDFLGRLGSSLVEAGGSNEEKTLEAAQKRQNTELAATVPLRKAQIDSLETYRRGELANAAAKNDIAQQKSANLMRLKGYVEDPEHPGTFIPMTEDQILSDPLMLQNQEMAHAAILLKTAQAAYQRAHAGYFADPNNQIYRMQMDKTKAQLAQAEAMMGMAQRRLALSEHNSARMDAVANMNYFTGQTPGGDYFTQDEEGNPVPLAAYRAIGPSTQSRSRADAARATIPLINNARVLIGKATPTELKQANDTAAQAVQQSFSDLGDTPLDGVDIGVIRGRIAKAEQYLGNMPPRTRELAGTLVSIYSLAGTMHGWRALAVAKEFGMTYGGIEATADSLAGGLTAMENTANSIQHVGSTAPGNARHRAAGGDGGGNAGSSGAIEYTRGEDGKLHPKKSKSAAGGR